MKSIIEELKNNKEHNLHCVGLTPRTSFKGNQKEHDLELEHKAGLYQNVIDILTLNKYIVRDWMDSNVFEFNNYDDALKKYNELLEIKGEVDVQFYKLISECNNVN